MATRRVTPSGSVLHLTPAAPRATAPGVPISNARLAMVIFLAFETMFFAALVAAFLVFRLSAPAWPPPDLPKLPIAVTWLNTFVLLASGWAMARAVRALRRGSKASPTPCPRKIETIWSNGWKVSRRWRGTSPPR